MNSRATSLLAELAADHGVDNLEPDADGLVAIDFDDHSVALGFSESWDSVFMTTVLAQDLAPLSGDYLRAFQVGRELAARATRLAIEPDSSALILIAEAPLQHLTYGAFSKVLENFVQDMQAVRRQLAIH